MFIDSRLEFSDRQVTTGSGTVSTHTLDAQARQIGPGTPLFVVVQAGADVSATVVVTVQTADAETFTGADTIGSITLPTGTKAGMRFVLGFAYSNKRFLRLRFDNPGTFSAWLSGEPPAAWRAYPAVV